VNPLSVLTAWNVMRNKADLARDNAGWYWLDTQQTTRCKLDSAGKIAEVQRQGKPAQWISCGEAAHADASHQRAVFWARPGTPLKTVMLAMHRSETAPVALFHEDDSFAGAIGVRDVLQAVLKQQD
jgi:glycine betaine/proline transport system ATP-binding protein